MRYCTQGMVIRDEIPGCEIRIWMHMDMEIWIWIYLGIVRQIPLGCCVILY